MLYYAILFITISFWQTAAQNSYQIEDIPIEHYVHEDIQQDEIDVELMPRSPRFLPLDNNKPLDLNYHETQHVKYYFGDLRSTNKDNKNSRLKRDATSDKLLDKIGKPLELLVIETENKTKKSDELNLNETNIEEREGKELGENFVINDFIRFRRAITSNSVSAKSDNPVRTNTPAKFIQRVPEGSLIPFQKDVTRETRGATKEQWVKQAYPVQRDDGLYDDNLQLSSEASRAPRVHFVTNGMTERDPLEYKFNREPRSGPINKYSPSDLSAEMDYYQPRFARNYVPRGDRSYYDRYPTDRRDSYRGNNYPEKPLSYNPDYNTSNRKRRIIYYATLPEVPRNSRNDDLRRPYDRYYYRDRYDERYLAPELYDNYRKRYYGASRYDEDRDNDPLYPIKVSTDVKVREVKKNPERRIYSEVDRTPYPQN